MKNCPACHANYPTDYTHCPRDLTPLRELGVWAEGTVVRGRYQSRIPLGHAAAAWVRELHTREFADLRRETHQVDGW